MKNIIFYYTGTGNSLWLARKTAELIGGAEIISISSFKNFESITDAEITGLVFPVHIWGVPGRVLNFLNDLGKIKSDYIFALAVNAGQVSNTLVQLKKVMNKKGLELSAGFDIVMPSNYIPWGGPGNDDVIKKRISKAETKISSIAPLIKEMRSLPVEKGPLWQRIIFSWIYNISMPHVKEMDKNFWSDDKCNGCGICSKVCPSENISLIDKKPIWNRKCEQCLSCIQFCPKEAIQYGKKTPLYKRYHHPEIELKDIIKRQDR